MFYKTISITKDTDCKAIGGVLEKLKGTLPNPLSVGISVAFKWAIVVHSKLSPIFLPNQNEAELFIQQNSPRSTNAASSSSALKILDSPNSPDSNARSATKSAKILGLSGAQLAAIKSAEILISVDEKQQQALPSDLKSSQINQKYKESSYH